MAVANALKLEGGTRETAAASALALLLAGADGQMKLQSTLNHGLPPPDTNTSIRFMTAGQSWIRYGICRTSRLLQHSVTRLSYGIELKNAWAPASTTPIATTVSSPRATCGKLLLKTCGRSEALTACGAAEPDAAISTETTAIPSSDGRSKHVGSAQARPRHAMRAPGAHDEPEVIQ